jgi:hypothetical protein
MQQSRLRQQSELAANATADDAIRVIAADNLTIFDFM